jgi:hypothetical protein
MKYPPRDKAKNISPNWLSVDKATIFLPSVSISAAVLAIVSVLIPIISKMDLVVVSLLLYLIKSQTPAVTKVELCTKALTGVGAAIAAGNQLVKGTCALLVNVRKRKRILRSAPFI